jgi:sporulation protein YlmC with PRC-barrel domain
MVDEAHLDTSRTPPRPRANNHGLRAGMSFHFDRISGASGEATRESESGPGRLPGDDLATANALLGDKVVNSRNEPLGTVTELVLDTALGRLAYAVVALGGFMGVGEQLFVIPWSALVRDAANRRFLLDADRALLAAAPPVELAGGGTGAGAEWQRELHRHYRARPYWE